jgi:hypothetical protein
MADGGWINPLSSFQEMGTLAKALLLVGFVFLVAALIHDASFSNHMLPVSLAFISLSLAVHYFSECRKTVTDGDSSVTVTDKGKVATGIVMFVVTVVLVIWTLILVIQNPKAVMIAPPEISKPGDAPAIQTDSKINTATPAQPAPQTAQPESEPQEYTQTKPTARKSDAKPAVKIEQHGAGSGAVGGDLSVAPGGVAQVGGVGNQATIVQKLPARSPTDKQLVAMVSLLSVVHANTQKFRFIMGDLEAAALSERLEKVLRAAHWDLKGRPEPYQSPDVYIGIVIEESADNNGSAKALKQALDGCKCNLLSFVIPAGGLADDELNITIGQNTDKAADMLLGGTISVKP